MNSQEPFLVIYPSKWKLGRSVIIALVFITVGFFARSAPLPASADIEAHLAFYVMGYLMPLIGLYGLYSAVKRLVTNKPVIVVTENGITLNDVGPIAWSEVRGLVPVSISNRRFFGVQLHDVDKVAAQFPKKSKHFAWNQEAYGAACFVPEIVLPMRVDALIAQTSPYYAAQVAVSTQETNSEFLDEDRDEESNRLYNTELQTAIEEVTRSNSAEARRHLYEVLQTLVYCIPTKGAGDREGSTTITTTKNDQGQVVLVAFSDPNAMRRWTQSSSMILLAAQQLFEMAQKNEFAEILINPAGPVDGKLTQQEYSLLARGILPV